MRDRALGWLVLASAPSSMLVLADSLSCNFDFSGRVLVVPDCVWVDLAGSLALPASLLRPLSGRFLLWMAQHVAIPDCRIVLAACQRPAPCPCLYAQARTSRWCATTSRPRCSTTWRSESDLFASVRCLFLIACCIEMCLPFSSSASFDPSLLVGQLFCGRAWLVSFLDLRCVARHLPSFALSHVRR